MILLMMNLAAAADLLEIAYHTAREELIVQFPDIEPEKCRGPDGRYILLDALTALVHARIAMQQKHGD